MTLCNFAIASPYPKALESEIAHRIRNLIRTQIGSEFHGTWAAGIIAANSEDKAGILGVAPYTQILPVRVFGLRGAINTASLSEAKCSCLHPLWGQQSQQPACCDR
ncbi:MULTISPECIES: S8 family serine peptidase [Nostocales]|uniref:S8 family serine peptidase n=1 Tax=Nostocales TaxID=1161 RepID=UPI00049583CE|nr:MULTISPECIES: S8 family serine peptidase [Nostocales]